MPFYANRDTPDGGWQIIHTEPGLLAHVHNGKVLKWDERHKGDPDAPEPPAKNCKGCGKGNKLTKLISGGVGLLKAELGIDAVDMTTYELRKSVCLACPVYDFGVCRECGCVLAGKARVASERCPIGKW